VYFLDASHFVFGAFLGYVWCLTRIFVPTAAGRQRYNVLGAIDIIGKSLLTVSNTTYVNATTVCEMLVKMAAANVGKSVTVFLDNARYQHCALVMDKARELGIELLFLPPYSPNLNLIERFWKYVKKTCLTNRAFTDFLQFRTAIDTSLEDAFTKHTEELKTLLMPNFQIIEFSQFQAA
jgi:transposase